MIYVFSRNWPLPPRKTSVADDLRLAADLPLPFLVDVTRAEAGAPTADSDRHRVGEASIAFEVIAVLAMPGGVLGTREQQAVTVVGSRLRVILQQRQSQLLVVRVIADFGGRARQGLDERRSIVACPEIRGGEGNGVLGPKREQGLLELLAELAR